MSGSFLLKRPRSKGGVTATGRPLKIVKIHVTRLRESVPDLRYTLRSSTLSLCAPTTAHPLDRFSFTLLLSAVSEKSQLILWLERRMRFEPTRDFHPYRFSSSRESCPPVSTA